VEKDDEQTFDAKRLCRAVATGEKADTTKGCPLRIDRPIRVAAGMHKKQ